MSICAESRRYECANKQSYAHTNAKRTRRIVTPKITNSYNQHKSFVNGSETTIIENKKRKIRKSAAIMPTAKTTTAITAD